MTSTRLRWPAPQPCSMTKVRKVSISPNHLSTYIFSRSPAPGGPSKPRPKDKFGKELYSRRRIPAFTSSPLPQNTSNLAGEAVVVAEAKTDQQKANAPRKRKRRARKTLTVISPANETIAQINRLIRGEGGEALRHFDPARAQQASRSRVLIDLNPSPLTSHFHHLDPTSSLTQDWNQPPHPQVSPTHDYPQPPHYSTPHNPHQRPLRSKPWPTRKEIKMASQYVPPHLRRGNQHSPYVFNFWPHIHASPFSFSSFHPVLTLA